MNWWKKVSKPAMAIVPAMALALGIALLPGTALTARAESDAVTTGTGTEEDPYVVHNWEQLKGKMALGGYIQLAEDVEDQVKDTESYLTVCEDSVTLDLNGHTVNRGLTEPISSGYVILVERNASLTVTDSSDGGNGRITGGNTLGTGGGITIYNSSFTLEGGYISENHATFDGGGISAVGKGISVTITGGGISNNSANNEGGGVNFTEEGTFTISGGTVFHNSASNGGGIYFINGTIEMTGGSIAENFATDRGGGIYMRSGTLNMSGNARICSNTACRGGAIDSQPMSDNPVYINISGGSITENILPDADTFTGNAAGIYAESYTNLTITGGQICKNIIKATDGYNVCSAGIYKDGEGDFIISGSPVITENTYNGLPSNVGLRDVTITINGRLEDAQIGINAVKKIPSAEAPIIFTSGYRANNQKVIPTEFFTSDDPNYVVTQDSVKGEAQISVPESYELYLAGTQVTDANSDDLSVIEGVDVSDEGYAYFVPAENKLMLKNVTIRGGKNEFADCGLNYNGREDFKISVEGNVKIYDDGSRTDASGGLIVGKPGEWVMEPTPASLDITIAQNATLTLLGGTAEGGYYPMSSGLSIRGEGNLCIHGGGKVIAKGGSAMYSYGITVSGGDAIFDENTVVEASGANDVYYSSGIEGMDITVKSGSVTGIGGNATGISYGMYACGGWYGKGSFTISGGEAKAVTGSLSNSGESAIALNADKAIIVNGGIVEAVCNATGTSSRAVGKVPDLADGIKAGGSVNSDGSGAVEYQASDNDTYKWFKCPYELPPKKPVTEIFDDVKEGAWYVPAIQYVYDKGIMVGKGSLFGIGNSIKREDFVQTLYSMSGKPEVDPSVKNPFSDVKNKPGYPRDAILWANENGIVKGNADGTFGVGKDIQRQAVASILYQYAKYIGVSTDYEDTALDKFSDKAKVQSWATESMKWAVTKGIISGKGNEKTGYRLDPTGKTTREECAAMLKKIDEMPRLK